MKFMDEIRQCLFLGEMNHFRNIVLDIISKAKHKLPQHRNANKMLKRQKLR